MTAGELLMQYVFLHNYGIEAADFEPLMRIFDNNIIFEFEDPRIGVFEGIESVRRVFRLQPPSDAIVLGEILDTGDKATAEYADDSNPEQRLGIISVDISAAKITRIFIGK
jgi:hypothetical protein